MNKSLRLTKETVKAIKYNDKIYAEIAEKFNIRQSTASRWIEKGIWKRLTAPVSLEIISRHLNKPIEELTYVN